MDTVLPVLMRAKTKTGWEAADEMPNIFFFNPGYPSESTESLLLSWGFEFCRDVYTELYVVQNLDKKYFSYQLGEFCKSLPLT